jgi:DNA-binding NtrC family response regulator
VLAVRVAAPAGVPSARRASMRGGELAGCRVLIVDDQPDAADLLAFVLVRAGAKVRVAASGTEALRLRVLAAGFDACTTKPLDADDLVELLEALR